VRESEGGTFCKSSLTRTIATRGGEIGGAEATGRERGGEIGVGEATGRERDGE